MNLQDIENVVWNFSQFQQPASQQDWRRQYIRDMINLSLEKIATVIPDQIALWREATLALSPQAGASYSLSDWATRAASFYTSDVAAHKVRLYRPRMADRNNLRNSSLSWTQLGPFAMTIGPNSPAAYRSGIAGASTGASATSGALTVTVNGSPGFDGTEVGRMLKLNGEYADYMITKVTGNVLTVDKPIYCRLSTTGRGVTGVGSPYVNVRWDVGPAGRCVVQFLPKPTSLYTQNYRYLVMPRKLLNPDDVPEIRDEYHELLYKGALKELAAFAENTNTWQMFKTEFDDAMQRWMVEDREDQDSEDAVDYDRLTQQGFMGRLNPDVNPPRAWQ